MTLPAYVAAVASADSTVSPAEFAPIVQRTEDKRRDLYAKFQRVWYPDRTPKVYPKRKVDELRSVWTKQIFQTEYDGTMARAANGEGQSGSRTHAVWYPKISGGSGELDYKWDVRDPGRDVSGGFWGPRCNRVTIVLAMPTVADTGFGSGGYAGGNHRTDANGSSGEAGRGDDRVLSILGKQPNPQWDYTSEKWAQLGLDNALLHEGGHRDDYNSHTDKHTSQGETIIEIGALYGWGNGHGMMNVNRDWPLSTNWLFVNPENGTEFMVPAGTSIDAMLLATGWSWGSFALYGDYENGRRFGRIPTNVGDVIRFPWSLGFDTPWVGKEEVDRYLASNALFLEDYVDELPPVEPPPLPPPCEIPLTISAAAVTLRGMGATYGLKTFTCGNVDVTEETSWTSSDPDLLAVSEDPTPNTDGVLRVLRKPPRWGKDVTITAQHPLAAPLTCRVTVRR